MIPVAALCHHSLPLPPHSSILSKKRLGTNIPCDKFTKFRRQDFPCSSTAATTLKPTQSAKSVRTHKNIPGKATIVSNTYPVPREARSYLPPPTRLTARAIIEWVPYPTFWPAFVEPQIVVTTELETTGLIHDLFTRRGRGFRVEGNSAQGRGLCGE